MTRLVVAISPLAALLAGCAETAPAVECGVGTILNPAGDTCIVRDTDPELVCGVGTHEQDGECVPDTSTRFELRMRDREISADRLQLVPVVALGTHADGTPVTEAAILSIDRPGAGAFPRDRIELDALGGVAHYRPCSSTQAGCLGPVRFSLALAAAPRTPVATFDAELVERTSGSAAASCLVGAATSNVFFDGEDAIYAGTLAITDAGWGARGGADNVRFRVEPNLAAQGRFWRLEFSTEGLGTELVPGVYEHAQRLQGNVAGSGRPAMDINGIAGTERQCQSLEGKFEVHDYEADDAGVERALISFEQRCTGAARVLRGCVRYQR